MRSPEFEREMGQARESATCREASMAGTVGNPLTTAETVIELAGTGPTENLQFRTAGST